MSCGMTDRRGQPTDEELKAQEQKTADRAVVEIQSKANERQVGGKHYKSPLQHWDFIDDHGYSYLIGCATKYPMRWRQKNGAQDIEKSMHFVQKALEQSTKTEDRRGGPRVFRVWFAPAEGEIEKFLDANNPGKLEREIVGNLLRCHTSEGRVRVEHALTLLDILLDEARRWEREEVRRSQYGMKTLPACSVRGFDPQQDTVQHPYLCSTVGGPDRPVKLGDTVVVKSHLPEINGEAATVIEVDGVWVKCVFEKDGQSWTDQYKSLTIIEKNV